MSEEIQDDKDAIEASRCKALFGGFAYSTGRIVQVESSAAQ